MSGVLIGTTLTDGTKAWVPIWQVSPTAPPPPPPPPPPPGGATIFGFNTSDATRNLKVGWFNRCPMGRGYYGYTALPASGAGFNAGGKEYKLACVDLLGAAASKRVNVSTRFHPGDITGPNSAKVIETVNYVKSIPVGWYVTLCHHEYNKKGMTVAEFDQMKIGFQYLSHAVYNQSQAQRAAGTGGRAKYVVNAGDSGLGSTPDISIVPLAADMAPDYEFWTDSYYNPNGVPNGYKGYGTAYPAFTDVVVNAYDIAEAVGCLDNSDGGDRGYGYGEIYAPRRIAPNLASLDAGVGWGPLSPHDVNGQGCADKITEACTFALGQLDPTRTVPAKTFLLWSADTGTWNHRFDRAGDATHDDGTAAAPGPHYQGFPVTVDPTRPVAAYKAFVDISA